ncbi:MAG: hypothetical protein V2I45_03520 [Halieaceae bacterium]|nr:hypothetical protein [Halieaceae bacterium]
MVGIGKLLVIGSILLFPISATAAEENGNTTAKLPLSETDRIALTTLLIGRHPEIASSPGLKASYYIQGGATNNCGMHEVHITRSDREGVEIRMEPRPNCDTDFATLYFLPHNQRLGRGKAARVNCHRPTIARVPSGEVSPEWACNEVVFREYVQLEGQVCEVRLRGHATTPALMAARQAGLEAIRAAGRPLPEALVVFSANATGNSVGIFGTNDCEPGDSVQYSLTEGGDPEESASWTTKVVIQ